MFFHTNPALPNTFAATLYVFKEGEVREGEWRDRYELTLCK